MKTLILIVLATLLVCNSAFAADKPASAVVDDGRAAIQNQAETPAAAGFAPTGRRTGLDLRNIPEHLRWLVQYAWMLTHRSVVIKGEVQPQ